MNPIIAQGLMSIGHNLLNNFFEKQFPNALPTQQTNANTTNFASLVDQTTPLKLNPAATYLAENKIFNVQDLQSHKTHLTGKLLNDPQLSNFLSGNVDFSSLTLQVSGQNEVNIVDQYGNRAYLSPNSDAYNTAMEINRLSQLEQSANALPNTSLLQIANGVNTSPQNSFTGGWSLAI